MTLPMGPRSRFGAAMALIFAVLFLAPIVPVSNSFVIRNNYRAGYSFCLNSPTITDITQMNECLRQYAYGPVTASSAMSISYYFSGFGEAPYPRISLIRQGDLAALVRFHGGTISYVEGPFLGPIAMNPLGELSVEGVSIVKSASGLVDFSANIRNIGSHPVEVVDAYFDYPGYGVNTTVDGVVWHRGSGQVCELVTLDPGASCTASLLLSPNEALAEGTLYPLSWVVVGNDPALGVHSNNDTDNGVQIVLHGVIVGGNFIVESSIAMAWPPVPSITIDTQWVHEFMSFVDAQRGVSLNENASLDAFAQTRFQTAVSAYSISDYDFDNQSKAYIGGSGAVMSEEILYPNDTSPADFAQFLQSVAPGHWNGLISPSFAKYGFYLGQGPAIEVDASCPVREITQMNQNITQLMIQNGCKYQVGTVNYLMIVLSS